MAMTVRDLPPPRDRPDLSRRALTVMLGVVLTLIALALLSGSLGASEWRAPGSPLRQGAAILGALLLLVPLAFSVVKRAGLTASPPVWFVGHVHAALAGSVLIFFHAAGGRWLTPPGVILLALLLVVVQALVARAFISPRISTLFASKPGAFRQADPSAGKALGKIIEAKAQLLADLDPGASEALFSPNLGHWRRHPWLSLRYLRLAAAEARLVGARRQAGWVLGYWRRLHIALASLLLAGMVLHVVLVLFFAGYLAQGGEIDWWHITAWGGPS
jgi:hypothetical protein